MKRGLLFGILVVFLASFSYAAPCNLDAILVSQDPYPGMPGEYVELVFQITGVENPECGEITFQLLPEFPFSLDSDTSDQYKVIGGTYNINFRSFLLAPYDVKIDADVVEGDNELKAIYYTQGKAQAFSFTERFNISVDDVRTDFEVSIKDYDYNTRIMTLEILNFGEHDADSLVVEIPKQEGIDVKGSNRFIIGSLDANEDTTFTYEAIPKNGNINLKILYTDEISERREIQKAIVFDSAYFTNRKKDEKVARPVSFYVLIVLIALIIIGFIYKRIKHRRRRMMRAAERR